jgi:DNA-binding PadR family transcriptional regulator
MTQLTPDETILGLLAAQSQHGYHLLDYFRDPQLLGEVWNLSTSQLYAVLKRLSQQGLVVTQQTKSIDGPERTKYMLTEAGYRRLEPWLHEESPSSSIRRVRVEFLSRLYIARLLNIPTAPIVKRQKEVCLREHKRMIEQRNQSPPGIPFLALELQIAQLETILKWLDRCELVPKDIEEKS